MNRNKKKFFFEDGITYLNHGSYGACPKAIFKNYQHWQFKLERQPVKFFTNELINLFLLSRENNLEILSLKGSYAGAMGYGQFIPSSYRAYAIDFDNDGYVDLLNSVDDAIGSIANYLYIHGWNKNLPTIRRIDQKFLSNTQSINNVRITLILAPNILHASDELENEDILDQSVLLLSYHERGKTDFFVGTANFIAITKYNRSHFYAKAVYDLSLIHI